MTVSLYHRSSIKAAPIAGVGFESRFAVQALRQSLIAMITAGGPSVGDRPRPIVRGSWVSARTFEQRWRQRSAVLRVSNTKLIRSSGSACGTRNRARQLKTSIVHLQHVVRTSLPEIPMQSKVGDEIRTRSTHCTPERVKWCLEPQFGRDDVLWLLQRLRLSRQHTSLDSCDHPAQHVHQRSVAAVRDHRK